MNAGACFVLSILPWYGEDTCYSQESCPLKPFSFTYNLAVLWFGLSQIVPSWFWVPPLLMLIILYAVSPEILQICRTKVEGTYYGCGLQNVQEEMCYILIKYCLKRNLNSRS